jgi:type II secretion system protein I
VPPLAMPSRCGTARIRGFTLIEVLVALVILSTGIVLVLGAFEASLSALGRSRDVLLASVMIRERMTEADAQLREAGRWEGDTAETFSSGRYRGFVRRCEVAESPAGGGGNPAKGTFYTVKVTAFKETSETAQSATTCVYVPAKPGDAASQPGPLK